MCVVGAAIVVSFEPAPGATLAAVWDGSEWATVHGVVDGVFGPVIERWAMHDRRTDQPAISCTPEAFAELVQFRLTNAPSVAQLVRLAAACCAPLEPVVVVRHNGRSGVPNFSHN